MSRSAPFTACARHRPDAAPALSSPADGPLDDPQPSPAAYGPEDFRAASRSAFRRARSAATRGVSSSGRPVPRPPGRSASPPPSTTSGRPGGWVGWRSGSSRCAVPGSRASARRTWRGSTRRATRIRSFRPTRRCICTRTVPRVSGPAINVDQDPLPDVVLEVDHTTDVRRGKLRLYEAWGFPEVWVLVPPESPGTPARARRSPPSGRAVSGGAGEPRVPGMADGRDLSCPDRGTAVAEGEAGPGAGGAGDGLRAKAPGRRTIRSPARSSGRRRRGATKKAAGKRPLRACSQYSEPGASRRLRAWPRTRLSSAVFPAMP